jgi:hypothetical protein
MEAFDMLSKTRLRTLAQTAAVGLLASGLAVGSPHHQSSQAQAAPANPASDRRSGFGRPESITGAISMVNPEEGLLIVAQQGAGHATVVSGVAVVTTNEDGSTTRGDTGVSAAPGPAVTEYRFRVGSSTLIQINGRNATLSDLAGMQDQQVAVRFVPERNGNFAKRIDAGSR